MKRAVECPRCQMTTTYTNDVEYNLWASRPGCPACTKPGKNNEGGEQEKVTAPESMARLCEWLDGERKALFLLRTNGIISDDETAELDAELVMSTRSMLGLGG